MNDSQASEKIDEVLCGLKPHNLGQLFDIIGEDILRNTDLNVRTVNAMNKRMQATSLCAMGNGIAIPNVKVKSLKKSLAFLYVMDHPVMCDTPDGKPVDIFCVVLSPAAFGPIHLQRLSHFSRLLKDRKLCDKIRETNDSDIVRALLSSPDGWMIAA